MNLKTFFIILFSFIFNNLKASDQEDLFFSQTVAQTTLEKLPFEMIAYIGSNLYRNDFLNFSLASKKMRTILMSQKSLFIPDDLDSVIEIIEATPIENISGLILEWSRSKSQAISMLRQALSHFTGYPATPKEEDLKFESKKFTSYIITANVLYTFGDRTFEASYKGVYNIIQDFLCDEHAKLTPPIYIFHLTNLSLLCPEVRPSIAESYQEGIDIFEKDHEKSKAYSIPLRLPLTYDMLYKK